MKFVESPKNPRIKDLRKLLESKKERDRTGLFVLEGLKPIEAFAECGGEIVEVYFSKRAKGLPKVQGEFIECSPSVLESISDVAADQQVCASARQRAWTAEQVLGKQRIVVVEDLQDPGNLGTLLRTAAAFGYGLFLTRGSVDLYNPKVIRSVAGNLAVPVAYLPVEVLVKLNEDRFVVTTYKSSQSPSFDWRLPLTIVLGNEGRGLRSDWRRLSKANVWLPAHIESLNVAVTGAILMWEGLKVGPKADRGGSR
ncbi:RNA methyltransferase [Coprothermobacteraceae bacterium]|nr:RNA methyltransferase [Coprothermobacteraceae bacterium]